MVLGYAEYFDEIEEALKENVDLRKRVIELINHEALTGKCLEGDNRAAMFKCVLKGLVNGWIDIKEASSRTIQELPQEGSRHRDSAVIFSSDWSKRLVHAELSRFYNQAVIEKLLDEGYRECFVPYSKMQNPNSRCTQELAGKKHELSVLHNRLIQCYHNNDRSDQYPKIPDHPYCSHIIMPVTCA
jgi:hypothetical protein